MVHAQSVNSGSHLARSQSSDCGRPQIICPRLPEGLSIYDLVEAFELLLAGAHEPPPAILEAEQLTVGQKMEEISALLRARGTATFWQLLPHPYTRGQVIVTFLAVLELLRRAGVVARQKSPYGEIMLVFCGAKEELE